jgi:hypothetical protein
MERHCLRIRKYFSPDTRNKTFYVHGSQGIDKDDIIPPSLFISEAFTMLSTTEISAIIFWYRHMIDTDIDYVLILGSLY